MELRFSRAPQGSAEGSALIELTAAGIDKIHPEQSFVLIPRCAGGMEVCGPMQNAKSVAAQGVDFYQEQLPKA
ncbi:MAG: hypothetical protein ACTHLT_18750 [Devosia sp.]